MQPGDNEGKSILNVFLSNSIPLAKKRESLIICVVKNLTGQVNEAISAL